LRHVWVEPAKDFTGRWVTYFVNGVTAHDIDYLRGSYRRFRSYYDNGQLVSEQRYVDGKVDGPEVGFHPDGKKAYEIRHAAGKHVGRWVHFYPNGQIESVETWVNGVREGSSVRWREDGTKSVQFDYRAGKETGQAAWDEKGALLYAHGTAEQLRSPKPVAPRNP
jgi:antitoxin component YwqK of YwqJK toxin-antitoxin module